MDTQTAFVSAFCSRLAEIAQQIREQQSWYILGDKRPGDVMARLDADAKQYSEYVTMFRP